MSPVMIDNVPHLALISCHYNDTFSYYDGVRWVRGVKTVPQFILDDPELPDCERMRVVRCLSQLGRKPS